MKIGTMIITAGVLALGLATWTSKAQGPLYDRVNVTLPYSVTVGERTLQPGDYVIQQLRDNGASRVLLIYSDAGMKFETSAMTIPALEGADKTQDNTRVILHHFGNDYYFDKVWIQGKNYGYEFPLPDAVKARERERMQPVSVAANYSSVQSTESTKTTESAASSAPTTAPTTTPAATSSEVTTPAATPSPATTPSTPAPQPSTAPTATTPADTSAANRAMPNTAAGWLMMLLSGGALSGAGMALRRKR